MEDILPLRLMTKLFKYGLLLLIMIFLISNSRDIYPVLDKALLGRLMGNTLLLLMITTLSLFGIGRKQRTTSFPFLTLFIHYGAFPGHLTATFLLLQASVMLRKS